MRMLSCLMVPLFCTAVACSKNQPKVSKTAIKPSRETTVVTEPLDSDGYPDYEAALNEKMRGKIKPEENACVLLWKAIGPTPGGFAPYHADYWKWLGTTEPPKEGDYFVDFQTYLTSKGIVVLNPDSDELKYRLMFQPWSAADYPHSARWLESIDKPLAIAIEASKKKEFYHPIISRTRDGKRDSFFVSPNNNISSYSKIGTALTQRAMLRVQQKQYDEAWQDLIACHRLGRLIARENLTNGYLAGIILEDYALRSEFAFIEHSKPNAKQLNVYLQQLDSLPPLPGFIEIADWHDRFLILDAICLIHIHGFQFFEPYSRVGAPLYEDISKEKMISLINKVNWDRIFRTMTQEMDKYVAIFQETDRAKRDLKYNEYINEKLRIDRENQENRFKDKQIRKAVESESDMELIEDYCCYLLWRFFEPMSNNLNKAYVRTLQSMSNQRVAFALAAFHADKKAYPAKLEELTPQYIAKLPGDLYSGKPLVYRRTDAGYILYAVGENEIDDGGKLYTEYLPEGERSGDDIGVNMPSQIRK